MSILTGFRFSYTLFRLLHSYYHWKTNAISFRYNKKLWNTIKTLNIVRKWCYRTEYCCLQYIETNMHRCSAYYMYMLRITYIIHHTLRVNYCLILLVKNMINIPDYSTLSWKYTALIQIIKYDYIILQGVFLSWFLAEFLSRLKPSIVRIQWQSLVNVDVLGSLNLGWFLLQGN